MKRILLLCALIAPAAFINCAGDQAKAPSRFGWKSHAALGTAKLLAPFAPLMVMSKATAENVEESTAQLELREFGAVFIAQIATWSIIMHSTYTSFAKAYELYHQAK